jgi:hypothetical protein
MSRRSVELYIFHRVGRLPYWLRSVILTLVILVCIAAALLLGDVMRGGA